VQLEKVFLSKYRMFRKIIKINKSIESKYGNYIDKNTGLIN